MIADSLETYQDCTFNFVSLGDVLNLINSKTNGIYYLAKPENVRKLTCERLQESSNLEEL